MGVLFKINKVLANLLIYSNENNIDRMKVGHKFVSPGSYKLYLTEGPSFEEFRIEVVFFYIALSK